ncbi:MAG: prolyl oligopeptidase family serine peptidase [Lentisphaeria bacterium]|nr:prolyl oligopeptidase family serine peptidase [Lentisphaeria bacterium]
MERLRKIDYFCSFDNSKQKAICFFAEGDAPRPLLVGLHTWSATYEQDCSKYAKYCIRNNWNFIFPDFRGPNWTPQACGSDAVVSDVADAVAYMKHASVVDNDRIYLIGGSGGGHCSLLMASRRPDLWTAVSAWCAISDVAAWHDQCVARGRGYAEHIRKACGGDPSKDPAAKADADRRSPVTYMAAASRVVLDISTGIHDGHNFNGRNGSVPVSQSFWAFNALANPADRISGEDIDFITAEQKIPEKFGVPEVDPAFAEKPIHFRRQSNLARITIFEGGHDCLHEAGLDWLAKQNRKSAADWSVGKAVDTGNAELDK